MPNVITFTKFNDDGKRFIATGTIVLSGSYVQASGGGEPLNFAAATFPLGEILPAISGPDFLQIGGNSGYGYGAVAALPPATPLQVGLKVATSSATELSAGAYPAGVTGDLISFEAHFKKFV